ncbi:hypothetical protein BDQ17DRAFT_1426686 [Cyathus striatus]|nr:hypothetical protein BDQ17DRAFT_1426686 [Cyathus striatus]
MDGTSTIPPQIRPRSASFSSLESRFEDTVYISQRDHGGEPDGNPQGLAVESAPRASQPVIIVDEKKWHTLSSFLPLLKLLSAFTEVNEHYILSGLIADDDIHSFKEHAKHVKEFIYPPLQKNYKASSGSKSLFGYWHDEAQSPCPPHPPLIPSSVYLRLLTHQHTSLLPSLERLHIIHNPEADYSILPLFHTPSLTSIELVNLPDSPHLYSFLISLYSESPGLESITLRGPQRIPVASLSKIGELKILQRLVLDRVVYVGDYTVIQSISQLQYLTELVIHLDPDIQGSGLPLKCQYVPMENASPGFMALQLLQIRAPFRLITDLLRNVSSTWLKALDIAPIFDQSQYLDREHLKRLQGAEQRNYNDAMRRHKNSFIPPARKHVFLKPENLTFESDYLKEIGELILLRSPMLHSLTLSMATPVKLPILSPEISFLAQLRSLEYLEISHWAFASTKDLELLLSRLDKLKTLKITPGPYSHPIPLMSLNTIVASCPLLETLELMIDSTLLFADVYPNLSALKRNRILNTITIGSNTSLSSKEKLVLARHMDYLFPNMSEMRVCGYEGEFWKEVWDIVELCQRVRRDEREDVDVGVGEGLEEE